MCRHDDLFAKYRSEIDHILLYQSHIIGIFYRVYLCTKTSLEVTDRYRIKSSLISYFRGEFLEYDLDTTTECDDLYSELKWCEEREIFERAIIDLSGKRERLRVSRVACEEISHRDLEHRYTLEASGFYHIDEICLAQSSKDFSCFLLLSSCYKGYSEIIDDHRLIWSERVSSTQEIEPFRYFGLHHICPAEITEDFCIVW